MQIHDKHFKPFITALQIQERVSELGKQISQDYAGKNPMFIVILNGAIIFASDLFRSVSVPCTLETMSAKSYGSQTTSSGTVTVGAHIPNVQGRHVILVEDIVDTGLTLQRVTELLQQQHPESITITALLSKPAMHKTKLHLPYICFDIPPAFVVGYGLDYAEHGRNLPDIYVLDEEHTQ
ncbi:MAG: hypoxanthine phosphoribosyltransferase [Candidatus Kapaibacterium sp.]